MVVASPLAYQGLAPGRGGSGLVQVELSSNRR